MTETYSRTETYTDTDVEATFRRFSSDIFMIADSTRAITRDKAADYAYDAEFLAKRRYLKSVDVTLIRYGVEIKAARYTVNERAGDITSSRPGGVLWPRIDEAWLRVILSYKQNYTAEKKRAMRPYLKIDWVPSKADKSHASLTPTGGRDYTSGIFGIQRSDFG